MLQRDLKLADRARVSAVLGQSGVSLGQALARLAQRRMLPGDCSSRMYGVRAGRSHSSTPHCSATSSVTKYPHCKGDRSRDGQRQQGRPSLRIPGRSLSGSITIIEPVSVRERSGMRTAVRGFRSAPALSSALAQAVWPNQAHQWIGRMPTCGNARGSTSHHGGANFMRCVHVRVRTGARRGEVAIKRARLVYGLLVCARVEQETHACLVSLDAAAVKCSPTSLQRSEKGSKKQRGLG